MCRMLTSLAAYFKIKSMAMTHCRAASRSYSNLVSMRAHSICTRLHPACACW